jgi:hypothetical protein
LASWAGKAATFASVTFIAYLIGIVSKSTFKLINGVSGIILWRISVLANRFASAVLRPRWLSRFHRWGEAADWIVEQLPGFQTRRRARREFQEAALSKLCSRFVDDQAFRTKVMDHVARVKEQATEDSNGLPFILEDTSVAELERHALRDYDFRSDLIATVVPLDIYLNSWQRDSYLLAQRLIGRDDKIYESYDRLRSEGDFRLQMVMPVTFLITVLAVRFDPLYSLGYVIPFIFGYLGAESVIEAQRYLAGALSAERIESPVFERLSTGDIELLPYDELLSQAIHA